MTITSKNIIYVDERAGRKFYRARISRKNENGEYENAFIDVKMPKGTDLENKTKINIKDGFLSFYNYTDKDGNAKLVWYIVVLDYTVDEEVNVIESKKAEDYDLPF